MMLLVCTACLSVTPFVGAMASVSPHAAMLHIAADGVATMTLEVPGLTEDAARLQFPNGVQVERVASPTLSVLLAALVVPYETSEVLEFNGVLDPTQIPTLTPYTRVTPAAGAVTQSGTDVALEPVATNAVYTLKLTCPGCANEWYTAVLALLPIHTPVLVLGNGVADCGGLWRVRAQSPLGIDGTVTVPVVTLLTVQNTAEIGKCTISDGQSAPLTPPVRLVTVDGTQTLLRLVFCLVVVLLLSVGSFYGAVALTKRMHSAVGFRREDR
ncbi:MAG: hypothetical protein RLY87_209 [Chloroflexota bacterium]